VTPIYSGYGGVINITESNNGLTSVYVYRCGIRWGNTSIEDWRNTSVLIPSGQQSPLGLLFFAVPSNFTDRIFTIQIGAEVENEQGTGWEDLGTNQTNTSIHASFSSPLSYQNYTIETNPSFDYSSVNGVIDPEETRVLAANILTNNSNIYSIQSIADAFDWVREHINYVYDTQDHWQTPSQTLSLRTGDCKDQAVLLASLIDQMGGNSRINIIDEHAFPTVYVGNNSTNLTNVQKAISSHYGTDVPIYFLKDPYGYWMVIDTTGFPYAGGLPTLSGPVVNDPLHSWSFDSSRWLIEIDTRGLK
jgi:transglutaminase-like putative cysteine protease